MPAVGSKDDQRVGIGGSISSAVCASVTALPVSFSLKRIAAFSALMVAFRWSRFAAALASFSASSYCAGEEHELGRGASSRRDSSDRAQSPCAGSRSTLSQFWLCSSIWDIASHAGTMSPFN